MIDSTVFIFANICLQDLLKSGYCQDRRFYGSDKPDNHANDSSLIFENAACENWSHFDWTRKSQNTTWVSCPWYNNIIYLLAFPWVDGIADYNIDYVKVKGQKKELTLLYIIIMAIITRKILTILQLCLMFYFHVFRRPEK